MVPLRICHLPQKEQSSQKVLPEKVQSVGLFPCEEKMDIFSTYIHHKYVSFQLICRLDGGKLAEITNASEKTFLEGQAKRLGRGNALLKVNFIYL